MIEHHLDLTTPDGEMPTFIVHPDSGGPHPLVVFLMDAPGMREELHDMCRRLATSGYYVLAPMLYYRDVRQYNVFETGDRDRMFELMNNVSNAQASADAKVCMNFAQSDPAANASKVGTVGYCMSGPFTIALAADYPSQVTAAASIHGVALVTDADDSPHLRLSEANAEIYVGAAETDSYAPQEMIDAFAAAMNESGSKGQVEWYPGTEHGFAFAERPLYDKQSSERHWERLHDLFRRNLH